MMNELSAKLKLKPKIKYVEKRHEVKHAYCDHSKAKKLLKLADDTNIEQTLEEMFIWGKNQPNRKVKKIKYEVTKNIYSYWK